MGVIAVAAFLLMVFIKDPKEKLFYRFIWMISSAVVGLYFGNQLGLLMLGIK